MSKVSKEHMEYVYMFYFLFLSVLSGMGGSVDAEENEKPNLYGLGSILALPCQVARFRPTRASLVHLWQEGGAWPASASNTETPGYPRSRQLIAVSRAPHPTPSAAHS